MRETPTLWMPSDGCLISLSFALVLRRSGGRRLSTDAACCRELGEGPSRIAVLPRLDLDLCRRLRAAGRSPLVLAAAIDADEARRALDLGLEGVVDMDTALDELPSAIDALCAGERWLSPSLACRLGMPPAPACC
jgi:DNA-binding NarL/FixJ family response regulator